MRPKPILSAGLASLLLFLTGAGPLAAGDTAALELTQVIAEPADGPLLTRGLRNPVVFRLQLAYSCPARDDQASVFVSVADTDLAAALAESPRDVIISVPAAQLPGIVAAARCEAPGPRLLREQLHAYATLVCSAAAGRKSQSVAVPLAVWFDCPNDPEQAAAPTAEATGTQGRR